MYFNVNFNVFFKLIKGHLLVSELYIYQNARCNDKKKNPSTCSLKLFNTLQSQFTVHMADICWQELYNIHTK